MSEAPTLREVPPYDGSPLGWDQTLYALLSQVGEIVWVSTTPTEDFNTGPGIVFASRLLRVLTVERHGEEWAFALKFDGGASVSIPKPGFRGAIAHGHDLTLVTDDATILIGAAT